MASGHLNDEVTVKVEPEIGVSPSSHSSLEKDLQAVIKAKIGVTIMVEVVSPGDLPRYELKAKRFFDHRPKAV